MAGMLYDQIGFQQMYLILSIIVAAVTFFALLRSRRKIRYKLTKSAAALLDANSLIYRVLFLLDTFPPRKRPDSANMTAESGRFALVLFVAILSRVEFSSLSPVAAFGKKPDRRTSAFQLMKCPLSPDMAWLCRHRKNCRGTFVSLNLPLAIDLRLRLQLSK